MNNRGSSLVELLLYTGLLSIILAVLYQLFSLAGYRKLGEVVEDAIYIDANRAVADLQRTIQGAVSIDEPLAGASSSTLSLNGGSVVYTLSPDNRLQKTEGGETDFLTTPSVTVSALTFTNRGPSAQSPTVSIDFSLAGVQLVEGREVASDFTTAVTMR